MYSRLAHIARADKQDEISSRIAGTSFHVKHCDGISTGHNPQVNAVSVDTYSSAKHEPKKVGNVGRTGRIVRAITGRERVYAEFERVIRQHEITNRGANQLEARRAKRG